MFHYLATLLALFLIFDATDATRAKLCYSYFGSISDLGWTFSFNLGRLKTHEALVRAFPGYIFESVATQNAFFVGNATKIVEDYALGGCNVILTNNELLLGGHDDYFTSRFPAVQFVLLNDAKVSNFDFPNRVYVGFDYAQGYFIAGAGAAAQSSSCIAFLAAWSAFLNPVAAFSGFLKGVRSVNATIPVHVISQNSWYYPDSDVVLTDAFVSHGCDIIAHYSDPREVDLRVSSAAAASGKNLLSIGPHSELQQYVGDTVLSSVYLDWSAVLVPILTTFLQTGALNQTAPIFKGVVDNVMTVAVASPLASDAARTAMASATATIMSGTKPVCGPLTLSNGQAYVYNSGNCVTLNENIASFITDAHTIVHPSYTDRTACAAGTFYRYEMENGLLELTCTPCGANTYSSIAGSAVCAACESGTIADAGSASCKKPPLLSNGAVAGIVVGGVAALALVSLYLFLSRGSVRRNRNAPREAPLCLLFTDVESSTSLWQTFSSSMAVAMETHHRVIREVIEACDAYEVKTVGDAFMIATKSVVDGTLVAIQIQRALQSASWPSDLKYGHTNGDAANWNGLRVRIGVHYCTDVIPKYEALQQYYDYYGNDVNVSARVESSGLGGQIVMTSDTFSQLSQDPEFDTLIGDDATFQLWATNVTLKGVEGKVALFSCVPKELTGRKFPAPEGCEPDTLVDVLSDKASNTDASSRAGATAQLSMPLVAACLNLLNSKFSPDYQKQLVKLLTNGLSLEGRLSNARRLFSAAAVKLAPPSFGMGGEEPPQRRQSRFALHNSTLLASSQVQSS